MREDDIRETEQGVTAWTTERIKAERGQEHLTPAAINRTSVVLGLFEELINNRKKFAADAVGQEAVVADVAEIMVRDMSDEIGEEVACGKGDGLSGVGIVVKIFKRNEFSVIGLNPRFAKGRTFEIFAEIFDIGFAIV